MTDQKKILIVEDNELNMKLFRDILVAHDYQVVATNNGLNAYELVQEEQPNLIIMDIQLPNISGIDIIRQIRKEKQFKNTPIIAVTAFAMQEDKEQILAEGCEDYIAKPISIKPFIEKIQLHMENVA